MSDTLSAPTEEAGISPAVREAPVTPREPELRMADIQGNSIVGFNKPFQTLLHYHIDDAARFKPAIAELGGRVSTAAEVLTFNREFSKARSLGHSELPPKAWMNVAFTYAGLAKLRKDVDLFADASFRRGMVRRSAALGDPVDPDDPGNPRNWKVRDYKGSDTADLMIIVAADTADLRDKKIWETRKLIEKFGGVTRIRTDEGVALPESSEARGAREHFGFRDGISQPRPRGRASQAPDRLRVSPLGTRGARGRDLVWPGEFVFGYPDQPGSRNEGAVNWMSDGSGFRIVPDWAKDGSYLVFRRLQQNVHKFNQHLRKSAQNRCCRCADRRALALLGAPIERTPDA